MPDRGLYTHSYTIFSSAILTKPVCTKTHSMDSVLRTAEKAKLERSLQDLSMLKLCYRSIWFVELASVFALEKMKLAKIDQVPSARYGPTTVCTMCHVY